MNLPPNIPTEETCAYCGSRDNLTDDHVPPQAIFAKPRPSNLITVPACAACHRPTSKDDEYFRIRLGLNDQARGHPDVNANIPSILRSLSRTQAEGMRRQFAVDSFPVQLKTPCGLYAGPSMAFRVDLERIFRVVQRTVRGLFYHETGRRLPDGHDVAVWSNETLTEQGPAVMEDVKNWFLVPLLKVEPKVIGRDVFSYRHQILPQGPSAWLLGFYRSVFFLALTSRPPTTPEEP